MQLTAMGMVIRSRPSGDDRLLTLLTDEYGVLQVVAKNAGKPRGKLAASTELFCYDRLQFFRYREHLSLDAAEVEESFFPLRQNLDKLALATYFAELFCELAPPEEEAKEYLRLLLNTLSFLVADRLPLLQLKAILELRLLTMAGFMPDLTSCSCCGEYFEEEMRFSVRQSAIYCRDCDLVEYSSRQLPTGILAAMRHIIYSPFARLFSFTLSTEGIAGLSALSEEYLRTHLERSYRSLDFFHTIYSPDPKEQIR